QIMVGQGGFDLTGVFAPRRLVDSRDDRTALAARFIGRVGADAALLGQRERRAADHEVTETDVVLELAPLARTQVVAVSRESGQFLTGCRIIAGRYLATRCGERRRGAS